MAVLRILDPLRTGRVNDRELSTFFQTVSSGPVDPALADDVVRLVMWELDVKRKGYVSYEELMQWEGQKCRERKPDP